MARILGLDGGSILPRAPRIWRASPRAEARDVEVRCSRSPSTRAGRSALPGRLRGLKYFGYWYGPLTVPDASPWSIPLSAPRPAPAG